MASEVEICNMALVPLGVDRISSLTEETHQAKVCNAIYSIIRDEELSNHTWSFATKRVQLAQTTNTPVFEFSYEFQIPTDCLRILNIDATSYEYRVEGDKVVSDYATPYIRYIYRVTDTTKFSQQFISLLTARLKYELSISLTDSKTLLSTLYNAYTIASARAKAIDSQSSGTPYSLTTQSFITSRSSS